ncbi:MAG: IclR family transcriptional regulator [Thiobacillus sp.]|jgi:DNA-binding IclR family transcriptional regulator|uniref:IclR family transcriptional regulator n=1 Tax=Thiobacillus sp. TaxID=924 RepID=UPI00289483E3|nr:IclR family transcriptional regulator [Thiobacillus sp.]MDT3707140.1 IclR family transcriptional regulator [Thiobacillus sp.]
MKNVASSIQVLDRAMALVGVLSRAAGPMSLTRIADQAGLHTASAHRILGALMAHGLVEKTGAGEYDLGVRWLEVGNRLRSRLNIRQVALPTMQRLAELTGETVNLIVRRGDEAVYVERVSGGQTLIQVVQVVGAHAPLHVTAVGKIFLAEDRASGVMGYAERTGLQAFTPNTLTTLERLEAELDTIRREQLAYDRGEAEVGVACIGAPIRDAEGKLVAGMSISAPADRHKPGWAAALKQAAAQTGAALGYLAEA